MPEEKKVSGAPDKKGEVIWDADNRLVHPELKKHFEEASKNVLRTGEEAGAKLDFDLEAPAKAQARDDMTAEPTTSPEPSSDPNQKPSAITINPDEKKADKTPTAGVKGGGGTSTPSGATAPSIPAGEPTLGGTSTPSTPSNSGTTSGGSGSTGTAGTPVAGGTGGTGGGT